jgi:hypothetical protein
MLDALREVNDSSHRKREKGPVSEEKT